MLIENTVENPSGIFEIENDSSCFLIKSDRNGKAEVFDSNNEYRVGFYFDRERQHVWGKSILNFDLPLKIIFKTVFGTIYQTTIVSELHKINQ